jgi:hypothetical protein
MQNLLMSVPRLAKSAPGFVSDDAGEEAVVVGATTATPTGLSPPSEACSGEMDPGGLEDGPEKEGGL